MKKFCLLPLVITLSWNAVIYAQEESKWTSDLGFSFFKSSINNQPDELLYNPVFARWENINQQPDLYTTEAYKPLKPYQFNLSVGFDYFIRYKKYLMIKLGICYTNNLGIGGDGNISYTEKASNISYHETKETGFSSFQVNYFVGPCIPVGDKGPEIFMGFSMMSPTWVTYKEKYTKTQSSIIVVDYNKTFRGFFGNCRSLIGMQVPVSERFKLGTELVFAYFNGIRLESGSLSDQGFKFPAMQWNFTFRYTIK
jgi:hypothetical protein